MTVLATPSHSAPDANSKRAKRGILDACVDTVAGLGKGMEPETVAKARGLFWFSVVAALILPVMLNFDRPDESAALLKQQLVYGGWFVLTAIMLIRITKNTGLLGVWIGAWAFVTIGAEPLQTGDVDAATLSLLTLLPILFGLTAGARACFISLFAIIALFASVSVRAYLQSTATNIHDFEFIIFCGFGAIFTAVTVGFFARVFAREAKALSQKNEEMRAVALTDALTRARNRHAFQFKFDKIIAETPADHRPAMLILDLDGFKLINDTYGHDIGDEVLKTAASRIRMLLQSGRTLYRLGGDEFAVVCADEKSKPALLTLANRLANAVSEPIPTNAGDVNVNVSIGVSTADETSDSLLQLYRRADNAAFAAKEQSGPSVEMFSTELDGKISRKIEIESGLKTAISNGGIDLVYQPQINLTTREVVGFEALCRWTDQQLGVVSPGEFIDIAERTSLIYGLDRLIISKALRQASAWLTGGHRISLNVSARSLTSSDFADFLLRQIERVKLNPQQVEIEITETALIENWSASKRTVTMLRNAGVRIALDDFGVGYSSLSYLAQFPVQKLKFDRSFLIQSTTPANLLVMQSIIQLAESMDMDVIAEGVEAAAHVSVLRRLRCKEGQGFYLCRPIPAPQVPRFLSHQSELLEKRRAQSDAA